MERTSQGGKQSWSWTNDALAYINISNLFQEDSDKEKTLAPQILEVEPTDAAEISVLTDESRLFYATEEQIDRLTLHVEPLTGTSKEPLYTTPTKQGISHRIVSTPETLPMDEEEDERVDSLLFEDCKSHARLTREMEIRVDDYSVATFHKTVQFLSANKNLQKVKVYRLREKTNKRTRPSDEMTSLFQAIRRLPQLKEMELYNFGSLDVPLLCWVLQRHPTLEKLHLHFLCHTADANLLKVLADAPVLREVSLDVQSSFPLVHLLRSKTLTTLRVPSETFQFEEDHFLNGMVELMNHHSALINLDLGPRISLTGLKALVTCLKANQQLRILRFSFLTNNQEEAVPPLTDLCWSLAKHNTSLRTIENHYSGLLRIPQADADRMMNILKDHKSLEQVVIFLDENSKTSGIGNSAKGDIDEEGDLFQNSWICGDSSTFPWQSTGTLDDLREKVWPSTTALASWKTALTDPISTIRTWKQNAEYTWCAWNGSPHR